MHDGSVTGNSSGRLTQVRLCPAHWMRSFNGPFSFEAKFLLLFSDVGDDQLDLLVGDVLHGGHIAIVPVVLLYSVAYG